MSAPSSLPLRFLNISLEDLTVCRFHLRPTFLLIFHFHSVTEAGAILSSGSNTEDPARRALSLRTHILQFQSAISSIERCRVPVILAAHGSVIGLGVDIACACDIRYASSDAVFAIKVSTCARSLNTAQS